MPYKVKLESFEGPLDLLLFLIKKNEVDIYDIPISTITHQYLEYIDIIKMLDIEAAGDFIYMASTLMRIKAQMLLPRPEVEDDLEEVEDPRQELVYRLLDYKRFKKVANDLAEQEKTARHYHPRGHFKFEQGNIQEEIDNISKVSLYDLISAFKRLSQRREKVTFHRVQELSVNLEERIAHIMSELEKNTTMLFSSLFKESDDKIVWIVTFIAILELIRQKHIQATQNEVFGEIQLVYVNGYN
ncbi:MAG: segregation/condensation protein A [candidate division KSB1 bacterium]|nr:segregation/condensation protein A [candidate division KSB1 bacterium]